MEKGIQGLKIGLPKNYFLEGSDKGVSENTLSAFRLSEKLGAKCKEINIPNIETEHIKTADEMLNEIIKKLNVDYIVMNAAVADYKMSQIHAGKLKTNGAGFNLNFDEKFIWKTKTKKWV